TIPGYSLLTGSNSSASASMFIILRPFEERRRNSDLTGTAIAKRLTAAFSQEQDGISLVIPPPPVRGIGTAGGFRMQVQDRSGTGSPQDLQAAIETLMAAARKDPAITALFSSFRAGVPQLYAQLDRTKAKQQNVT